MKLDLYYGRTLIINCFITYQCRTFTQFRMKIQKIKIYICDIGLPFLKSSWSFSSNGVTSRRNKNVNKFSISIYSHHYFRVNEAHESCSGKLLKWSIFYITTGLTFWHQFFKLGQNNGKFTITNRYIYIQLVYKSHQDRILSN